MPNIKNGVRHNFMELALEEAHKAFGVDEVPVGAVVVRKNQVIASAHNQVIALKDPSAHAEILAIRMASKVSSSEFLVDCDIYVTLEPCPMCAFALALARVKRIYFGAYDPKMGGVEHGARIFQNSSCHHKPEVYGGIMEENCVHILKLFFSQKR